MNLKPLAIPVLAALFAVCSCSSPEVRTAKRLASRISPEIAGAVRFVKTSDTCDVFTLSSKNGKVVIAAPEANSMAFGLNYYLRYWCNFDISWEKMENDWLDRLPGFEFPQVTEPVTVSARVDDRFYLNYCTLGYSMPWWKWEEWEWFIDYMAMNGVTRPLAITGQEAVWQKVWRRFGMSDDKIREYFAGPAVLPWQRMMNIDRWLGPLPQEWIDGQEALQKKIAARERELGMKPVLSAFSGHIPADMMEIWPDAKILPVSLWDGFGPECRTYMLHPDDPRFAEVQKAFLEEQQKAFGTDHIYGLDIFNEVDIFDNKPWDPQELARISHHVYETLVAADPEAIWLQMGWMMYHDSKHWTPEIIEAYLGSVPRGKVIMLDYFCEKTMIWEHTNSFYGQPYFLCFLGNFGGNTLLEGNFAELGPRFEKTLAEGGENLAGMGCTLEGFGITRFMCEYTMDRAWNCPLGDEEWVNRLADRICGSRNEAAREAWQILCSDVFKKAPVSSSNSSSCRHPRMNVEEGYPTWPYNFCEEAPVRRAIELLKSSGSNSYSTNFYLAALGCKVLEFEFEPCFKAFVDAYGRRNLKAMQAAGDEMLRILDAMDATLAACPSFSLDRWIEAARSWSVSDPGYYEHSARVILTTWGGAGQLTDYASRQWSGLVKDYYKVRWEMFIGAATDAVRARKPFDQAAFDKNLREFELAFAD